MYKYLSLFLAGFIAFATFSATSSAKFALYTPQAEMCSDPNFKFKVSGPNQSWIDDESPAKQKYCSTVARNKQLWMSVK